MVTGHYSDEGLDEVEESCSSCRKSPTYRIPDTPYRWCCMCGSLHVDKPEGPIRGGCLPSGAAMAEWFVQGILGQEKPDA